jgi:lipoprotein-releasing system permease protein
MSRLPFELLLALRYLRPKRTFVSVITLISIIGVMLGVAVLIVVISVMTGFDHQLRDRLLGFNAHLRVQIGGPMTDYASVRDRIGQNPEVKGVAPFVVGQVMVETQPAEGSPLTMAPWIRGIDPRREASVSTLLSSIIAGTNDLRGNGILAGSGFAERLRLRVGDNVAIYSIRDLKKMKTTAEKNRGKAEIDEVYLGSDYEIRGIFEVGYWEVDSQFVVASLANAQDMFDLGDAAGGLFVMLKDPNRAPLVRSELEQELGRDYEIRTWQEENSKMLDALVVEKNVMFYLLFFIMIVAAFGIMSALITFVVQKTREIGILKALGASSGQIMWIFLSQSLLVGVFGVLFGLGLGVLAVHYRNGFLFFMRRVTSFELFPAEIYGFKELPALVDRSDVALICGGSLVICLLAGLLPAWNAGRLKPVEALRHE